MKLSRISVITLSLFLSFAFFVANGQDLKREKKFSEHKFLPFYNLKKIGNTTIFQANENNKKHLATIFIIISIILAIALLGQLMKLFGAIGGIIKIFSGQLENYQIGLAIGKFIYWIIHISLIIFLWKIGKRPTKNIIRKLKIRSKSTNI